MSAKTSSTIGFERKHNPAVAPRSRQEFIDAMNANLPQRPPNMYNIVERNRVDYIKAEVPLIPQPLEALMFRRVIEIQALVIDTRTPHMFGEGHIPGALHVYLRGSAFATRVGFIASPENRLLLVVKDERDLREATNQLAALGFYPVVRYPHCALPALQHAYMTRT